MFQLLPLNNQMLAENEKLCINEPKIILDSLECFREMLISFGV